MDNIKRHKRPHKEKWLQNVVRMKRLKGEQRKRKTGEDVPPAEMGPPCQSTFCLKSKFRNCQLITEEQRSQIFHKFWSLNSSGERRVYIQALVTRKELKQKKTLQNSRRQSSYAYCLQLPDGSSFQVCKPLFASTFGVPARTLMSWVQNNDRQTKSSSADSTSGQCGPKSGKCAKVNDLDNKFLTDWLNGLPTVESHYCMSLIHI